MFPKGKDDESSKQTALQKIEQTPGEKRIAAFWNTMLRSFYAMLSSPEYLESLSPKQVRQLSPSKIENVGPRAVFLHIDGMRHWSDEQVSAIAIGGLLRLDPERIALISGKASTELIGEWVAAMLKHSVMGQLEALFTGIENDIQKLGAMGQALNRENNAAQVARMLGHVEHIASESQFAALVACIGRNHLQEIILSDVGVRISKNPSFRRRLERELGTFYAASSSVSS